MYLTTTT